MREIILVDQHDTVIGSKDITTVDTNDIYRVASLWIENTNTNSL